MATRSLNRELIPGLQQTISAMGSGPGGAPYPDARSLGPALSSAMRMVRLQFTPGTTVDDAGNVIAATDDLEVETGFDPLVAMLHCADTNEFQILHFSGNTNGLKTLNAGATAQGAFFTFAAGKATVLAASTVDAKVHTLVLMG